MANNRDWYQSVFKGGLSRPSGSHEITQSSVQDWERLRVLRDGKLVPFMPKGHMGMLSEPDLSVLRDEAKKGNIFFYRLNEAYPMQLVDDLWQSTDPAAKDEKKPELKLPAQPQTPPPYTRTLDDEMAANGLPRGLRLEHFEKGRDRALFHQCVRDFKAKKAEFEKKAELNYQFQMQKYESEKARVTEEYERRMKAWEKRIGFYEGLDAGIKAVIRAEEPGRRAEILKNQEAQRAIAVDNRSPVLEWYRKEFRGSIVSPNEKDPALKDSDGIDWSRVRIWDGEKFARVVPEGYVGMPSIEALQSLKEATEKGNLFTYQRAEKYPSKWMGNHWRSMDRNWIESLDPGPEPVEAKPDLKEPRREDFIKGFSNRKLATYRFFRTFGLKVYKAESDRYHDARLRYEESLEAYQKKYKEEESRLRENYEAAKSTYDLQKASYDSMLKSYNSLTLLQIAAMEEDVKQRTEEIKRNKEVEKKKADLMTEKQHTAQKQIAQGEKRLGAFDARPEERKFVNGQDGLGQDVYDVIAPHGYALPENSKVSMKDAAAIHIALAGSNQAVLNQGLSPMSAANYGKMLDGVLQGVPSEEELKYIIASYGAAKEYISAYANGDPAPLAEAMGEGLRNLIGISQGQLNMDPKAAGLAKVAERILKVLDQDPELMKKSGLKEEELHFARGLAELGKAYGKHLEADIALTQVAVGANTLPEEQVIRHSVDMMMGQAIDNRLKNSNEKSKQELVSKLGRVSGGSLEIVADLYRKDPQIQKAANNPKTLINPDLGIRGKELSQIVSKTDLAQPKASQQTQKQVKNSVQQKMQEMEEKRRQLQNENANDIIAEGDKMVLCGLMVKNDPSLYGISPEDAIVDQKYEELKGISAQLAAKGLVAQNGKPLPPYDPMVMQEAEDRTIARELMEKDPQNIGKQITAEAVSKRLSDMREALEELKQTDPNLRLEDTAVYDKAKKIQSAREERIRSALEDPKRAQAVIEKEGGDIGLGWSSTRVKNRMEQLRAAREALGPGYENLPINDMRVIQKDYQQRGVNPLKSGIVDEVRLPQGKRKDYYERMETISYLQDKTELKLHPNKDRYHEHVNEALYELRTARTLYESSVQGAEKDLPLNDPKINAMLMLKQASEGKEFLSSITEETIVKLAKDLEGKDLAQGRAAAIEHLKANVPAFQADLLEKQQDKILEKMAEVRK